MVRSRSYSLKEIVEKAKRKLGKDLVLKKELRHFLMRELGYSYSRSYQIIDELIAMKYADEIDLRTVRLR